MAILSDRLVELVVRSPALDVGVRLLLPKNWARKRWPTLYLLHGCCTVGDGQVEWTTYSDVEAYTRDLDALVVMPEAGDVGFYSDWLDGPAWETFHLTELRRLLERRYRAGDDRAIAGLSMGGFGTLSYAARHPGMFKARPRTAGSSTRSRHAHMAVLATRAPPLTADVDACHRSTRQHTRIALRHKQLSQACGSSVDDTAVDHAVGRHDVNDV